MDEDLEMRPQVLTRTYQVAIFAILLILNALSGTAHLTSSNTNPTALLSDVNVFPIPKN